MPRYLRSATLGMNECEVRGSSSNAMISGGGYIRQEGTHLEAGAPNASARCWLSTQIDDQHHFKMQKKRSFEHQHIPTSLHDVKCLFVIQLPSPTLSVQTNEVEHV